MRASDESRTAPRRASDRWRLALLLNVLRARITSTEGTTQVKKARNERSEPKRTIHHTETGGHSVDAREILETERAQKLIAEVATKLKVWRSREPGS